MIYKVAYDSWLYYKCTEKYLSIILLEFSFIIIFNIIVEKFNLLASNLVVITIYSNKKFTLIKMILAL